MNTENYVFKLSLPWSFSSQLNDSFSLQTQKRYIMIYTILLSRIHGLKFVSHKKHLHNLHKGLHVFF